MSSPHYKGSNLPIEQFEKHIQFVGNQVIINPLALDITWGGDSRYWRIDKSNGIAELVQVSWLEVNGSLEMKSLSRDTKYKLEFEVGLKPDAFGWNSSPVYMMAKPGKDGKYIWKDADLTRLKDEPDITTIPYTASSLEFTVPSNNNDKLSFGLFEIWKGRWKGGLVIKNVIISPV